MIALEWSAFGLALLSVLLYGRSVKYGALVGIEAALVFLLWGALGSLWGVVTFEAGFLPINLFNLHRTKQ